MSVDISAQVTSIFPTTENSLLADAAIDYAAEKVKAISRAKRQLYGSRTVPAEADIPEVAAYWVSDQAAVYLIPLAIDWYMNKSRISDNKENMTITYHNAVTALEKLRDELAAALSLHKQDALEAIDTAVRGVDVPAVSVQGMAIDPLARAMARGPVF